MGVGRVVSEDAVNGYTALGLVYLIVAMYAPDAASTFVFGMSTAYFGIGMAESLVAIARRLRRTP